jgi:hypothetical protein
MGFASLLTALPGRGIELFVSSGASDVIPVPKVDASLRNPWPAELEREFQARARRIVDAQAAMKVGFNTFFENEKRAYGFLMAQVLAGNEEALEKIQQRDHQHEEWHRETAGIDYYACFTLKHQMRKYFYFGDKLEKDYRKLMLDGAKLWTKKDPMRRPHYAHQQGKQGWGPDAMNSWVDIRSTENLYLMRVTSVYLMAEETGNRETTAKYKKGILDYTKTLYRVGIGEWDSENYHGHSIAPLLNLHDFAKDREVKAAAKACLDFMFAAGAVKYWRGGFNGPTKRDYNHPQPFGGSAPCMLWVAFGDAPRDNEHWESDEVHQITSAYRPPLAVVKLARKEFAGPVEIFAAKPEYSATTGHRADSEAKYLETQFIANSYQMGSLTGGTSAGKGDVNGFKILARDREQGAVALHAVPGPDPAFPGSPQYQEGKVSAENRVAQQENLALWLVKDGKSPWLWVVPEDVGVSEKKGVTFLECDRTWVAVRVLGGAVLKIDREKTALLSAGKKKKFPGHKVLSAEGKTGGFCGLAVEVGEKESHGNLEKFQEAVSKAEVDVSGLEKGVARYKSADGKWLGIHWNDDPMDLGVWRNGKRRDLKEDAQWMYRSGVISAKWGEGKLRVVAGGEVFECEVDGDGKVEWR